MPYYNRVGSSSPLILLTDDDLHTVSMLRACLETDGFRVISTMDGLTGERIGVESKPDLIITDIYMPGMDGISMVDHIREHPDMRHVPVIFLSGHAQGNVIPKEDPHMEFALLKKPIFLPELNQLIRTILGAL